MCCPSSGCCSSRCSSGSRSDLRTTAAAFALLAFSSVTDWLDGVIARRFHMVSRVGQLLDPIADRLFVASTIIVLAVREIVPWWLVVALLARDVVMFFVQLYVHRRGVEPLPVHYVGKAATACLLFGMPLLFLSTGDGLVADVAEPARVGVRHLGHRHLLVVGGSLRRAGVRGAPGTSTGAERMTSRVPSEPDASLSLLRRLVDDSMDPGYQEAADRRQATSAGWRHSLAFAIAIGLTAALVTAAVLQVREGAPVGRPDAGRAHRPRGARHRAGRGTRRRPGRVGRPGRPPARVGARRHHGRPNPGRGGHRPRGAQ